MLAKPRTKAEGFQMYKLAMLQSALNVNEIVLAKDAEYREGIYRSPGYLPLSDESRNETQDRLSMFDSAMKRAVTGLVAKQADLMPHTHGLNLLLKDTEKQGVSSVLGRLERHLDRSIKTNGVPKSAFSLYTYRDEVESAIKGHSRYAIRVKFTGTEAAERAVFDFVKAAMDEPEFKVEPTRIGEFGSSLRSFFESANTFNEAMLLSESNQAPFSRVPLVFPYTPGAHTVEHDLFMAESLKPLHDWELIEDNQRETQFFVQEYQKDYENAYIKYALNEFSMDPNRDPVDVEPEFG